MQRLKLFISVASLFMLTIAPSSFAIQQSDRTIEFWNWDNQPIEIVSVKSKGRELRALQPIQDDETWLNGLTITVKNVTMQPIVYADVLVLTATPGKTFDDEVHVGTRIFYGHPPDHPTPNPRMLPPGQSVDLILPASVVAEELVGGLKRNNVETLDIRHLILQVDTVFFDASTQWHKGKTFTRNANGRWDRIGEAHRPVENWSNLPRFWQAT